MAIADPQSIELGSETISLPRIGFGDNSGTFQSLDGTIKLTVSHASKKRNRHLIRLDHKAVSDDPFVSGLSVPVTTSVYLVIDAPISGYSNETLVDMASALLGALSASSAALLTSVVGGQS